MRNILYRILTCALVITLFSCGNAENQTEEPEQITDTVAPPSPSPSVRSFQVMMVKFKIADFAKWKTIMNEHDSIRKVYDLMSFYVCRGTDDPKTVLVISRMNNLQKAKEYAGLQEFHDLMKKAGVVSTPEIAYLNVIRNNDSLIAQKEQLMVSHHVKNFSAWIKAYDDEGTEKRMEEGLIDRGMARSIDDTNVVYLSFALTDLSKAKKNINSEAKKKTMMEAGVDSTPQFFYYKAEN